MGFHKRLLYFIASGVFFTITFPLFANRDQKANGELAIKVAGKNMPNHSPVQIDMDPSICGADRDSFALLKNHDDELQNVVVWLEPQDKSILSNFPSKRLEDQSIAIRKCEFTPRVSIVPNEGTLSVKSNDPILFQVRSRGKKNPKQSRSLPPHIEAVQFSFREPEIVPITCDLHSWMKAFVVVAQHSLFAVTNQTGDVKFKKLPSGLYNIFTWHELSGTRLVAEGVEVKSKTIHKKIDLDFQSVDRVVLK
jgi:hypothetical protein